MTQDKKKMLKEILSQLHAGIPPQEVKQKFKHVLKEVSSEEIATIEQELVREGMPREELQRLCDVHMAVFAEQLEKQELRVPPQHPLNILLEEHKIILQLLEKLATITGIVEQACDLVYVGDDVKQLKQIVEELSDTEKHYLREENVLFPMLEKHGITEPPAIMWMEHDKIREKKKQIYGMVREYDARDFQEFKKQLGENVRSLVDMLSNHIFKENSILYPAAQKAISDKEWKNIRRDFDEIGYCSFTPKHLTEPEETEGGIEEVAVSAKTEIMQFKTGTLSKEEIGPLLDALPVDISFVDANDEVRYFNKADRRIFTRTKSVIGRKVQLCHPQKSINVVNRIMEAFKTGKKNVAEFWITLDNRLIHIRYFAVRNQSGKYLGTLEVTQDLTDIKKIDGQRRLLDWKD